MALIPLYCFCFLIWNSPLATACSSWCCVGWTSVENVFSRPVFFSLCLITVSCVRMFVWRCDSSHKASATEGLRSAGCSVTGEDVDGALTADVSYWRWLTNTEGWLLELCVHLNNTCVTGIYWTAFKRLWGYEKVMNVYSKLFLAFRKTTTTNLLLYSCNCLPLSPVLSIDNPVVKYSIKIWGQFRKSFGL